MWSWNPEIVLPFSDRSCSDVYSTKEFWKSIFKCMWNCFNLFSVKYFCIFKLNIKKKSITILWPKNTSNSMKKSEYIHKTVQIKQIHERKVVVFKLSRQFKRNIKENSHLNIHCNAKTYNYADANFSEHLQHFL